MGMILKRFCVPKLIHNFCTPISSKRAVAIIIMSVSVARMAILEHPLFTASYKCKKIRVSASSWVHDDNAETSRLFGCVRTVSSCVQYICFPSSNAILLIIFSAKKLKNCILFSEFRRNEVQFRGIGVFDVT